MNTAARRKPGIIESRISIGIMVLLLVVAASVAMRQDQFNPAVQALRPDTNPSAESENRQPAVLLDLAETGIRPFSAPEHFTGQTLYEKINGRADLYLSSGFVSLASQRFSPDTSGGRWIELFAYDMGTAQNAFAVFSQQRRSGVRSDAIAPNAYRTDNALFIAYNRFYLELIGSDDSETLQAAMAPLATRFMQSHGDGTTASVPGSDLFPAYGKQADSLQYTAANAFGHESLDRIFTCIYRLNGDQLTAFVSLRPDAREAVTLAASYTQALRAYGAEAMEQEATPAGVASLRHFDTFELVFTQGPYLAGVHEAEDLDAATTLAQRLADHLEGKNER